MDYPGYVSGLKISENVGAGAYKYDSLMAGKMGNTVYVSTYYTVRTVSTGGTITTYGLISGNPIRKYSFSFLTLLLLISPIRTMIYKGLCEEIMDIISCAAAILECLFLMSLKLFIAPCCKG